MFAPAYLKSREIQMSNIHCHTQWGLIQKLTFTVFF